MKKWKKFKKKYTRRILNLPIIPYFIFLFIHFLSKTIQQKWIGLEKVKILHQKGQHVIFAFWHGRLLMLSLINQGRKTGILTGHHADAELIVRVIKYFGYYPIRGSTSKEGISAIRKLARRMKKGSDAGITPDGPLGPRYKAQIGAILLAHMTGCPIIPVSFGASKSKFLSSWDKFLLPYPFSKGVFIFDEPIWIDKKTDKQGLRQKQLLLEERLQVITQKADTFFQPVQLDF